MSEEQLSGYETVVVTEDHELTAGSDSDPPTPISNEQMLSSASLYHPAWQEVEAEIDPTEYDPGTFIGTIYYDIEREQYWIEYAVDIDD